jgi:D-inositol-3-phosphate glycosyltransferase
LSESLRIAVLVDPLTSLVGGGRHVGELSRALERRGHSVHAFGCSIEASSDAPRSRRRPVVPRLDTAIATLRPDALVAYDALSPAAWLGARVSRRLCVPLVLVEAAAWREGRRLQRALWRIGESLWGNLVRRTAGACIALEPQARELAIAKGFPAERVQLVPGGIDLELYRPGLASPLLSERRIRGRILVCAGAPESPSEVEVVVRAFAQTIGQRGDWSLVVVGAGPRPQRLRACADALGVGATTHFLTAAEPELAGLFSASTLLAVPRRDARASATDVARALACGVPVIAAASSGLRDVLESARAGLVVLGGDPGAWANALRIAASSPDARRRWSAAARRVAETRLGWPAVAAAFEAAIEGARSDLAGARSAAPAAAPADDAAIARRAG